MADIKIIILKVKKVLKEHKNALLALFFSWGLYFLALWPRIISIKQDGLYLGHVNVWSDWALHIGIASIFAYKSPQFWLAYHPMYAGGKFTYGFLTDAISGMFMRFGASVPFAFIFPSIVFTLLLIFGMYALLYIVLKSKWKAVLAISFFFLSSGLGFINFIKDFSSNPNLQSFLYPIKEYSRMDSLQWYSGNYVVGLLVPQRGFLLGMAMSVWIIAGLFYVFSKKENNRNSKIILVFSGFFAGILPITHMHSFIVLIIITGILCLFFIKKWKLFLYYIISAGIFSTFFYLAFINGGIEDSKQFFTWFPGWTIKGGFYAWAKTWLYLWGATIPLAILGFIVSWKKLSLQVKAFFASFFVIFILANLILIQPVAWDNSKLFLWVYFGFSALSTLFISWLWKKNLFAKIAVVILVFSLTATGFIELTRLQRIDQNRYMETSVENMQLGAVIRDKTDPLAVFLTSADHNNFIMVWGARPILMGYTAWVWNYGFSYQQREADIRKMYEGSPDTKDLLKKYNVSYVAIGPGELNNFHANENYFIDNFEVAFQNSEYRIYDVRNLLDK